MGAVVNATADTLSIKKGITNKQQKAHILTYDDHRMAMAFAPLTLLLERVTIEDKGVVRKSYPDFWQDLESLGLTGF